MPFVNNPHSKDPLHGVKLIDILEYLIENEGWEEMGREVNIRCFQNNQTLKSSLNFLRKTPWARTEVENYFLKCIKRNPMPKKEAND